MEGIAALGAGRSGFGKGSLKGRGMIAGQTQRQHTMIQQVKLGPAEIQAAIEYRRSLLLRREFSLDLKMSGRLEQVWFEAKQRRGAPRHPGRLDWNGQGPGVRFSSSGDLLLVEERMKPELPRIPDPFYKGEKQAPLVTQDWEDLATGMLEGRHQSFLVFNPVRQIIFRSFSGEWGSVICSIGRADDCTALLIDPAHGESYFIGGRLNLSLN